ncbi:MAG TPA: molybdenum cofactor guanylyltransferase [Longimicrobium sp.]|nr:molybdenum cofactor guanylyltransferase [Longimicrobium sp.]
MPSSHAVVVGAILAGGESRRFGSPKALARVDGVRIVDRVRGALGEAVDEMVVIANDPALFADLDLPICGDRMRGSGPLAGIDAALRWAAERGAAGALCVSCDLPFAPAGLLREIAARADADHAVVPESPRGHGMEPLCAWYPLSALAEVERALASDDRSLRALLASVDSVRVPLETVRRFGDPEVLFFNVNTRDDLERAQAIARSTDAAS